jgi:hypothetical protein
MGLIWFAMIIVLAASYVYLSLKLRKLCSLQDREERDKI